MSTVTAPVLSAPVTDTPAHVQEATAFRNAAASLMESARNLGPLALSELFNGAALSASAKDGTLTVADSLAIGSVFGSQSDAKHIGPAVASARKTFRNRLGSSEAVAKDRFPFKGESRSALAGLSVKYSARYAAGIKGSVQD